MCRIYYAYSNEAYTVHIIKLVTLNKKRCAEVTVVPLCSLHLSLECHLVLDLSGSTTALSGERSEHMKLCTFHLRHHLRATVDLLRTFVCALHQRQRLDLLQKKHRYEFNYLFVRVRVMLRIRLFVCLCLTAHTHREAILCHTVVKLY